MKYTIVEYPGLGFEVCQPFCFFWKCNAVSDYHKFKTLEEARAWIARQNSEPREIEQHEA